MPSISARHYRVVSRPVGTLSRSRYIILRRRRWCPLPGRLYYLPEDAFDVSDPVAVKRRVRGAWHWGPALPAKVRFALVAAAVRDGALPVNRDT